MIFCHVTLDRALAGGRVATNGASTRTASHVAFQMPLEVPLHRRLVGALGARENRLAGVSRAVCAPLHAAVGDEPRTVRAAVQQPSGVARFHVRRHLPLVRVRIAAVAAPEEPTARRQRLVDYRIYRRRTRLLIRAQFYFRFSARQLCILAIQVRRRPVFRLQQHTENTTIN